MAIRIIPRLDIKGPNLVKGVHLEGLRILGKPEAFAHYYYKNGADELIYIDTVASLYGRNNLTEILKKTAKSIFIPITVGGGVRSIDDMRILLRSGADKVAINTAAIKNPKLITQGSEFFGSQCIVVSIQALLNESGKYECLTDNARERTEIDVFEWAERVVDLGAGEILITSVNNDGTGKGYDIELVARIAQSVSIPVIACGGAGSKEDMLKVIIDGKADAVCAASIFHYNSLDIIRVAEGFEDEGNIEFISNRRGGLRFMAERISPASIPAVKQFLKNAGVACRDVEVDSYAKLS